MSDEHKNEEAIFKAALKLNSQAERANYLKTVCGNNTSLLVRMEALLKAHDEAGEFLEVPPFVTGVISEETPMAEMVGTVIGRYKLLEKIGEGGMAVVYMAQQEQPVRRKVALKVIKLGMDTKQVIARFEAERQALAIMDHPNIAKVFDAGSTNAGRPYFVMELVRGVSITEYCDKNNLSTKERLALFIQVCHAVQHAHQKGIIHRDIKPSNVMVTLQDGKPVPMVIDFGIAKATNQQLTEKTLFTRYAQMIGTPEYMSPEQAEMSRLDVDTRSDIYSLGVLLYELLTGTLPFDAEKLREEGYVEIQRVIREEEPDKPSTKLSTMGEAITDIAKHRKTNPESLTKLVRGDLDWIVMKSLEKDRTRRYSTPVELAADIERHLNSEPVLAGSPTVSYRLQKFIRRHRIGVTAGSLVATALVVGLAVAMYGLVQARQDRDRAVIAQIDAVVQREEAERQRQQALEQQQIAEAAKVEAIFQRKIAVGAVEKAAKDNKQTEQTLYFNRINLAEKHLSENNIKSVHDLLKACPNDLRGWEWYYLWNQSNQARMTLRGHENQVQSVAYSPDGKLIASGSDDNTLRVWDANNGNALMTLRGHKNAIWAVAFSPDSSRIVSGSRDNTLKVWDIKSRSEIMTLRGHKGMIWSVTFSPDGKQIASESIDNTIKLWDAENGRELSTLNGNKEGTVGIGSVAFSPDSSRIVSGCANGTLKIWDVGNGSEIMTLYGHAGAVISVRFSPDGKYIISGSSDSTLMLWDSNSGSQLKTFQGHEGTVLSVGFSPDGRQIVSGCSDKTLRVWNIESGEAITLRGHEDRVNSVAFSPDGRRIVSGSMDSTIKLWDTESSEYLRTLKGHSAQVKSVAFSLDGRRIVSGNYEGTLKLWDATNGYELMTLRGHSNAVWSVMFSADGSRIVSGSYDNTIKIWDVQSGSEIMSLHGDEGEGIGRSITISPNGNRIVSGCVNGTLKIWDVGNVSEIMTLYGHARAVNSVRFSPDDKYIISGSSDRTLMLWDSNSGSQLKTFQGHEGTVLSAGFSHDGRRIVSGGTDEIIKVWDVNNNKELMTLSGHQSEVYSVVFSLDDKRIISGSYDNTIKIWDTESGSELLTLRGNDGPVWSVAFSPDGRQIVSGSDNTIRIWKTSDAEKVKAELLVEEKGLSWISRD